MSPGMNPGPPNEKGARVEGAEKDSAQQASVVPPRAVEADPLSVVMERLAGRGQSSDRYEIKKEIARGGMGAILHVWDEDLRRSLAMKVVLSQRDAGKSRGASSSDPRVLSRFFEEAQVTGQLDHPGIVPVHEIGVDREGCLYFTMRLVSGRNLEQVFDLVRSGEEGWSQTRAVGALLKVCEAMAYAHSKGVIHRDLKPANVMVGRFGEVYVMDWGLARVMGSEDKKVIRDQTTMYNLRSPVHTDRRDAGSARSGSGDVTLDGDILGTPAYMSPEQARGDLSRMGPAADVYSVGAILYHLLAGHRPYAPAGVKLDAIQTWKRVRAGPPEPIHERAPKSPAELVAICEKAMAVDPAQRYAGMQEFGDDLRAYLEGRVVRAYETGAVAEFKKWVIRNRALAITVIAGLLAALIGSSGGALVLARKNDQLALSNAESRANEERAKISEARAQEQAVIAEDRAAKVLRLSDLHRLQQLEASSEALWPAYPYNVAAYEGWLTEARNLAERLEEHRKTLADLRLRGHAKATGADAWTFTSAEDQWQHDTQAQLVADLAKFSDPDHGAIRDVEKRLAFARTLAERTLTGPDVRQAWAEAIASIANRAECEKYAGLSISPQLGLVPLGRDPRSGLWEFAHVQTGEPPSRDPHTGELTLTEASSLVFVLIPGGTFWMGAQSTDPGAENYDPLAVGNESPVHRVTLAPFFLSKYEMTQGQWLRFTGKNPSIYGPDREFDGKRHSLLHPVEQVSRIECSDVVNKLGLLLPTEAQWEYAARAGTTTPWWTGAEKESLEGAANLADSAAARMGATWPSIQDWPELDDGYSVHAPVNEYTANPFGLYGVHGNVWEWCRDTFVFYGGEKREGDGELVVKDGQFGINRGGGCYQAAAAARSASRNHTPPDTRINHLGLRPSRRVE